MVPTRKCSGSLVEGALDQGAFGGIGTAAQRIETLPETGQLLPNQALYGIARLRAVQTKEAPVFKVENENDSIVHLSACCHPIQVTALWAFQMIKEMEIHRGNCTKIPARKGLPPVQINWALPESRLKGYKLNLLTFDDRGILFQITKVIKDGGSNSDLRSFQKMNRKL